MRRLILVAAVFCLALALAGTLVLGDLFLNGHRLMDAAMGRAGLIDACRPAVLAQLRDAGFQPDDLEFGEDIGLSWSSATGRGLAGPITFQDGTLHARVDGDITCSVKGTDVKATVRTETTPVRAT